jgi:hypothetical protein
VRIFARAEHGASISGQMVIYGICPKCNQRIELAYPAEIWLAIEQNANVEVTHTGCGENNGVDFHWPLTVENKANLLRQRAEGLKIFQL